MNTDEGKYVLQVVLHTGGIARIAGNIAHISGVIAHITGNIARIAGNIAHSSIIK